MKKKALLALCAAGVVAASAVVATKKVKGKKMIKM